jgi:lipid II:glycine glycyltransferase (peptidoglycan interpeptide bridge formation enzyme)
MLKVTEIRDPQEWKTDLNKFNFNIFITPEWIEPFVDSEKKSIYLNFTENDMLIGKIAGLKIKSSLTNKELLFFFSGPAWPKSNEGIIPMLINELLNYAGINKFIRLIVRSYDYKMQFKCKPRLFKITERNEYVIDLSKSNEEINNNLNKQAIKKINKAEKSNFEFIKGDPFKMADKLISLLEETKKVRLAKGYPDYSYFYIPYMNQTTLNKIINNNITSLYYVKADNEILSVIINLHYNKQVYSFLIGSDQRAYKLGINYFIFYKLVCELKEQEYEYFNLGGVPQDTSAEGLIFFKKSLGAEEITMSGGSSNYLTLPYILLNPLLNLGRKLPAIPIVKKIKKLV